MPRQRRAQTRDAKALTRQGYMNQERRSLRDKYGSLPQGWDLLATWPNGLDHETWEGSTHTWSIQDSTVRTNGEFWGTFTPEHLKGAYLWCFTLAKAKRNGLIIVQCGDMEFALCDSVVTLFGEDPQDAVAPPERDEGGLVRSNDACAQFREQVRGTRIPDQKPNSFRRMLSDYNVRKYKIAGVVWHDVDHINEVLQRHFEGSELVIRASPEAPQKEKKT